MGQYHHFVFFLEFCLTVGQEKFSLAVVANDPRSFRQIQILDRFFILFFHFEAEEPCFAFDNRGDEQDDDEDALQKWMKGPNPPRKVGVCLTPPFLCRLRYIIASLGVALRKARL
jgi:hypothetical protein